MIKRLLEFIREHLLGIKEKYILHDFVPDLSNRTSREKAHMILICPVHKLMCTACRFSIRLPKQWLSDELQKESENTLL